MTRLPKAVSISRSVGPSGETCGPLSVTVNVYREDDCWWAESAELPGMSIAEDSYEALLAAVRPAIDYYIEETPRLQGRHVAIRLVRDYGSPILEQWKDAHTA